MSHHVQPQTCDLIEFTYGNLVLRGYVWEVSPDRLMVKVLVSAARFDVAAAECRVLIRIPMIRPDPPVEAPLDGIPLPEMPARKPLPARWQTPPGWRDTGEVWGDAECVK